MMQNTMEFLMTANKAKYKNQRTILNLKTQDITPSPKKKEKLCAE